MSLNVPLPFGGVAGYVAVLPHVVYRMFASKTETFEIGSQGETLVCSVEYSYGVRTIGERAHVYLVGVRVHFAFCRLAERVLVDGYDVAVEQYAAVVIGEVAQVVA